jgi:hypothetical protein
MLLLLGGTASAGGKPAIAILGLEVRDSGTGVDPATTRAARELTVALRDRAKAGTGPFAPVQDGDKELIDEKLLNNCDSEAPLCMATIGSALGAEALVYGKIERSAQGYKVWLKLLSVSRRQLVSSTQETLPLAPGGKEPDASALAALARTWYGKLVAYTGGGTVVVKANIDRGTVMIDDEAKGNLASGALSIAGVAEGRHTLAIEAKDFQRYETSITVKNGETLAHSATLVEQVKKPPPVVSKEPISREGTVARAAPSGLWKPLAFGSSVVALGSAGFAVFAITKSRNAAAEIGVPGIDQSKCKTNPFPDGDGNLGRLNDACDWRTRQLVGWVVTGVAGAVALGSFYMAYMRDGDDSHDQAAQRGRRKRRELAITPILIPGGGGATVRLDW